MKRVLDIEAVCAGLWRVTMEAHGELLVDVFSARSIGEAWEKAMGTSPDLA